MLSGSAFEQRAVVAAKFFESNRLVLLSIHAELAWIESVEWSQIHLKLRRKRIGSQRRITPPVFTAITTGYSEASAIDISNRVARRDKFKLNIKINPVQPFL